MNGISNDRSPRPRYSSTWDVNTVLEKIKPRRDNSMLSMKQLSHKLAMLVALTTACRGSELKAMNPSTMIDRGSEVEFPIEVLTKGKTPSKPHLSLVLKEFEANPQEHIWGKPGLGDVVNKKNLCFSVLLISIDQCSRAL
jgi:hypothetical protein